MDSIAVPPERWKKIQEAFQVVVDLPPTERSSRLDQICAGDAELRREVEELIDADERASGFLEAGSAAGESPPAERVGPYRVLHKLGEGGMSEVYAAVREDDAYDKRVAVKFFRAGLARPDLVQRFRVERQILASLDHPQIAKLLDGGSTADGAPYLVMDYVEGLPIDEYCDRQRLPVTTRLELFQKVCGAVQYAHANLVVHRDLKPSNILVRGDGQPKLLDFGIAKLLNPDLFTFRLEPTRIDAYVMTPEYASPEQARGEPVTTAADVYSLGVLLYKLLTGSLPYDVRDRALPEIVRVVCEEEPARPSALVRSGDARQAEVRATTVRGLRRQLAGDLDNILLKALRKEPSRRYGSVEQLSEDIRRYREGLPVLARSDTLAYRTSKFLRRHRVSVAMAGLAALLVIAFAVTATIASVRLRSVVERSRAVTRFLQETLGSANPYGGMGRETTVVEMLERTERNSGTSFAHDPEVDATVQATVGLTYRDLGRYDRARPRLEKALDIRRRLYGSSHPTVASSLLDLAGVLDQQGDLAAEGLYREALAIDRAAFGADSVEASRALSGLGALFQKKGEHAQAEALLREALSARRRRLPSSDVRVARSLRMLGSLLHDKGDYRGAESQLQEALDILKGAAPQSPEMTLALRDHALLLADRGDVAAAVPSLREVLARQRAQLGEEHTVVAESRANLARVLAQTGDLEEAIRQQGEALAVFRRLLGEEHEQTKEAAASLTRLGQARGNRAFKTGVAELLAESHQP